MAVVNAYVPQMSQLMFETEAGQKVSAACIDFGGWNHHDKTLTPIRLSALLTMPGNPGLTWIMDSLAAAAEARILDGDEYIEQLFASKSDVRSFRLILRDAGGEKWLNDRHFTALKKLGCAELDAVTYAAVANFSTRLSDRRRLGSYRPVVNRSAARSDIAPPAAKYGHVA